VRYLFIFCLLISLSIASNPKIDINKAAITIISTRYAEKAISIAKEFPTVDIFINKINKNKNLYSIYGVNIKKEDIKKYIKKFRAKNYKDAFETSKRHIIYLSKRKKTNLKKSYTKEKIDIKPPNIKKITKEKKLQIPFIESNYYKELVQKKPYKKIKFDFKSYLHRLISKNNYYDNSYIDKQLTKIKNLIAQDRYNFDLSALTTLSYNREILETGGFQTKSSIDTGFVLSKKIYDGQKNYIYTKKPYLENRLSELKYLKAKEQVTLLGLDIYTNLLIVQEQLKIQKKIKKYKEFLLKSLNKREIVLKTINLDKLIIKNEILNIDKNILNLTQLYKSYNHIFRQSIDFSGRGKLVLGWFDTSRLTSNLANLKRMTLLRNNDVLIAENKLKLLEANVVLEDARKDWEVDFLSTVGYNNSKTTTPDNNYRTSGIAWQSSLTFKYPIYQRDDIFLNLQKMKLETLQKKNLLNQAQKNVLNLVENKYNLYRQYNDLNDILNKQSKILEKTNQSFKNRYISGVGSYKDYSLELSKRLENENERLINSINIRKIFIETALISGDEIFGE